MKNIKAKTLFNFNTFIQCSLWKMKINVKVKLILKINYFGLSILIFQINRSYISVLFFQVMLTLFMEKYTWITSKIYFFKAPCMKRKMISIFSKKCLLIPIFKKFLGTISLFCCSCSLYTVCQCWALSLDISGYFLP